MTDACAVTVFRFFGGNQLVFASNAVYSKGGAAIGYHRRHGNLLDTDPDKIKLSIIHIMGESFVCRTAPKGLRAGSAHHRPTWQLACKLRPRRAKPSSIRPPEVFWVSPLNTQQEGEVIEDVARGDDVVELDGVEEHRPAIEQDDIAEMKVAVNADIISQR